VRTIRSRRTGAIAPSTRRLYQRHGIAISYAEYRALTADVIAGKYPVICQGETGGTVHRIIVKGRQVFFVFCPLLQTISTALPGRPRLAVRA
jgi:hypothetical protein